MIYSILKALVTGFLKVLFFLKIEGAENIPDGGGYLVCSNHTSNWDPVMIGVSMKRKISYIAKEELFRFKPLGMLIKAFGAIPVKRGGGGAQAVRAAVDRLEAGDIIVVFPEGTRVKKGRQVRPKTGAVRIAQMCGAPILPVGISGKYRLFSKVTVRIGKPLSIEKNGESDQAMELTEKLMNKIYELAKE